jgi:hypothetical protein
MKVFCFELLAPFSKNLRLVSAARATSAKSIEGSIGADKTSRQQDPWLLGFPPPRQKGSFASQTFLQLRGNRYMSLLRTL